MGTKALSSLIRSFSLNAFCRLLLAFCFSTNAFEDAIEEGKKLLARSQQQTYQLMPPYQLLKSEPGPDLGIFKVRIDHQKNNRNQHVLKAAVLEAADSANVVAITPNKEIILVRQFRFGIGRETLEIPGGMVDKGEDIQIACARELLEETGYASTNWLYLGPIQANPVFMDSLVHQYIATDTVLVKEELQLDPAEQIEVVCLPQAEVKQLMLDRTIQHPHTLTALMHYFWQLDQN